VSTLSDLETKLGIVETDIVKFFSTTLPALENKVVNEVTAAAVWLDTKALPWLSAHGSEIAADVLGLVSIAAAAGTGVPAVVLAAASALNSGVTLVNEAIAAQQQAASQGASSIGQAVAAGAAAYQGLKTAQIATATAQSAAVPAPATP
jgi:hypothetical protein